MKGSPQDFRLGNYAVRPARNVIEGPRGPQSVEPRLIRLLVCLAERPGEVVERERLIDEVWEGRFVTDNSLNNAVAELRRILGESATEPCLIETVRGTGYRLGSEIIPLASPTRPPRTSRWHSLTGLAVALVLGSPTHEPLSPRLEERLRVGTSGPGIELDPALAPDGSKIAFAARTDDNHPFDLFVYDLESATTAQLTFETGAELSPVWSPDGNELAFLHFGADGCEVMRIEASGGAAIALAAVPCSSRWLTWSPDGRTLAISGWGVEPEPVQALYLDETGASLGPLIETRPVLGFRPSFSPDGRRVAFLQRLGGPDRLIRLQAISLDAPNSIVTITTSSSSLDHSWSREGLVFAGWVGDRQGFWLSQADGRRPTMLRATLPGTTGVSARRGKLAITKWSVRNALSLHSASTSEEASLFPSSDVDADPALAPNGKQLAFVSWRTGSAELWLGDLESGQLRQLTHFEAASVGRPRWSPDGDKIAFEVFRDGQTDILILDLGASTEPRSIASSPAEEAAPTWSPDGKSLLFMSDRDGRWALWRAMLHGGENERVLSEDFSIAHELEPDLFLASYTSRPGLWVINAKTGEQWPAAATAKPVKPQDLAVDAAFAYWPEPALEGTSLEVRRLDLRTIHDTAAEISVLATLSGSPRDPYPTWGLAAASPPDGPLAVLPRLVSRTSDVYLWETTSQ